jgi:hypothetical protein
MAIPIKAIIEGALKPVSDLIDSLHTSREEKDAVKLKLAMAQGQLGSDFNAAQASVIIAEATGASWIQRNWRPLTMLTFVFIIAWNYVFGPIGTWIAAMFGGPVFPVLDLPTGLWTTLNVGIGGYMTLRTFEKVKFGKEK